MYLFVSQFSNKIDKKGRVSLPSSYRNILPKVSKNEIILFKSLKFKAIEACSSERIHQISERIDALDFFSEDQEDFSTSIFSEIIPTNIDKEGRIQIPEQLKKFSNIDKEVMYIGQGHYFQIWEPLAAIERQKKSRQRLIEKRKTLSSILTKGSK